LRRDRVPPEFWCCGGFVEYCGFCACGGGDVSEPVGETVIGRRECAFLDRGAPALVGDLHPFERDPWITHRGQPIRIVRSPGTSSVWGSSAGWRPRSSVLSTSLRFTSSLSNARRWPPSRPAAHRTPTASRTTSTDPRPSSGSPPRVVHANDPHRARTHAVTCCLCTSSVRPPSTRSKGSSPKGF